MNIGDNIRKNRERAGLSTRDLADKVGVNHSTIVRYEGNKIDQRYSVLKNICIALNVTMTDLLHEEEGIQLNEKYVISCTGNNVTLKENYIGKDGNIKTKSVGYYGNLKLLYNELINREVNQSILKGLENVLDKIEELKRYIDEKVKE